jgi:hypothetical protein
LDKHSKAHAELQSAVRDLIDAIEVIEGLLVRDEPTRATLARKLSQAKMHLHDARLDMRHSRLREMGSGGVRMGLGGD